MNRPFGFKQFRVEGCLSYLVWDVSTLHAAVIDPSISAMDTYREFIGENRLIPVYALDTHTHADHRSATHFFRDEFGSKIGMSRQSKCARKSIGLADGDALPIGDLLLSVMETPGHTPDSVCYLFQGIAFTGDTLMIGALGRTDFPGSSPSQLFHSLHQKIRKLPASTLVMPGHDYNDLICSTIEAEFKASPQLQIQSDAEFDAFKKSEVVAVTNSEVLACIEYNLAASPAKAEPTPVGAMATAVCGKASSEATVFSSINVDKYSHKLIENIEGHLFVDVRERDEFEEGHMPGAKNIPLSEIGFHLSEFQKATRIYFSCLSGRRSSFAAKTLCRLGLNDVVNVTGGIKAWVQAGLPVKQGR